MNVTSKIAVDLTRANIGARVNAVQGDGNTRSVEITLLADGKSWTPPEGVEAAIAYRQPGGTKGLYNLLADGTPAISIAGNVATVILAPQMLTASGTVQASLVFNDAALNRLTTFPFSVSVASNPAAGAQKVEDYLRLQWLEDKLEEYLAALKASGVFDGKPGDNGVTFTPSVAENGDLSWSNDGGRPNPPTVNIMGPKPVNGVDYGTPEQIAGIAQQAADILGPEVSQIKDDLSSEQTDREQADTSLQQEVSGKLPKSPADWESWTAEEQAAARERMNAQESYRHIATITIDADEVYNVGIARDENGEVFALSDVYIYGYIKKTGSNEQIAVAINTIYTDINAGNNIIKLPSSYKKYGAQIELNIKKHTYWRASAVSAIGVPDPNINAVTGDTSVSHRGASNVRKNEWDTLSALAFSTENVAFGIGTTFDIWGR